MAGRYDICVLCWRVIQLPLWGRTAMFAFIGWLIIGLIAGGLARLFVPGRQPMSLTMTMILCLMGSVVGGIVSAVVLGYDPANPGFHPAGLILSTIGAVVVLVLYVRYTQRPAV